MNYTECTVATGVLVVLGYCNDINFNTAWHCAAALGKVALSYLCHYTIHVKLTTSTGHCNLNAKLLPAVVALMIIIWLLWLHAENAPKQLEDRANSLQACTFSILFQTCKLLKSNSILFRTA